MWIPRWANWPLNSRVPAVGLAMAGALMLSGCASAGELLDQVGDTAGRAAQRETMREVDRRVSDAVRCTIGDRECIEKAEEEGKAVEVVHAEGNVVSTDAAGSATPDEGAWANYDFVPGERILFTDDYSGDNVGDFPRRLEFVEGAIEIVERQGRRVLHAGSEGEFRLVLPEALPETFTVELSVHATRALNRLYILPVAEDAAPDRFDLAFGRYPHTYFQVSGEYGSGATVGEQMEGGKAATHKYADLKERLVPVRIMVDGQHVKVYPDETRVANLPNADLQRSDVLRFVWSLYQDGEIYMGPIHVAAGGRDLYNALATEGRVATHGVLFDTGSDRIRPESTPTLQEIGAMLEEHPELRLRIEGHTDNVGDAAANQTLSESRAAAVKRYLVENVGIDAGRLETRGFGASQPAVSNDTPEGRQQNRRVELVRLPSGSGAS